MVDQNGLQSITGFFTSQIIAIAIICSVQNDMQALLPQPKPLPDILHKCFLALGENSEGEKHSDRTDR